jgi:hypothetical protein
MTSAAFSGTYFSFLLSGKVEDFKLASEAFNDALQQGVPLGELQITMDESHASAEMLCLLVEQGDPNG